MAIRLELDRAREGFTSHQGVKEQSNRKGIAVSRLSALR